MASPSSLGPRMLRCPACNAGLPVDGAAAIVTCKYCGAHLEIDRRGEPQLPPSPGPVVYSPQAQRPARTWLFVPFVLVISGGMAAYQWTRAQAVSSVPTAVTVASPTSSPKLTTRHEIAASPPTAEPSATSEVEAPTVAPPSPRTKAHRGATTPTPAGPVISVGDARKLLEPKARACLQQAKAHHVQAMMGNKKPGPVKVLTDMPARVDGVKVALGKTALGRCLNDAGQTIRTSALGGNYVVLDVRNDDVVNPLGNLPAKEDPQAVEDVIAALDAKVKACARKHGAEGMRESFDIVIAGPSGKVVSSEGYIKGPFRSCAQGIYKSARFPKVQSGSYRTTYHLDL